MISPTACNGQPSKTNLVISKKKKTFQGEQLPYTFLVPLWLQSCWNRDNELLPVRLLLVSRFWANVYLHNKGTQILNIIIRNKTITQGFNRWPSYLQTSADIQNPFILVEPGAMILHVCCINARHICFFVFAQFASSKRITPPVPLLRLDKKVPNTACLLSTW